MKIIATASGLAFQLTQMEMAKTGIEVHGRSERTPREVMEYLAGVYTANFEQDLHDAIDSLEEGEENAK